MSADPMTEAIRAMQRHAARASGVDRRGWTTEQWAEDAKRLMDDIDGSIMSLVNGHVSALLRLVADHPRQIELAEARGAAAVVERVGRLADALTIGAQIERAGGEDHAAALIEAIQSDLRAALATQPEAVRDVE